MVPAGSRLGLRLGDFDRVTSCDCGSGILEEDFSLHVEAASHRLVDQDDVPPAPTVLQGRKTEDFLSLVLGQVADLSFQFRGSTLHSLDCLLVFNVVRAPERVTIF